MEKPCSPFGYLFRFFGWWFGFSGLYAMFSVCPFCGQQGCPVGMGSAGTVGAFFALCMQDWKLFFRFIRERLSGKTSGTGTVCVWNPVAYDAWYEKNRFTYLSEIKAVRLCMPESGIGLEVGVGTGRFGSVLGFRVGVDPSMPMLSLAGKRGMNACCGTGEMLPFIDNSFDYAGIFTALCFVQDPLQVLRECVRVVRPGGRLIIAIIDRDSFLGKTYQKAKRSVYANARFLRFSDVTDMLIRVGCRPPVVYQTIFTMPDQIHSIQPTEKGRGKGGFLVMNTIT